MFEFIHSIGNLIVGVPIITVILVSVGAVLFQLVLGAVILRAACDLCSVPAPGFFKAILLVLILSILAIPASDGIALVLGRFGTTTRIPPEGMQLIAVALSLTAGGLLATLIYTVGLRVRVAKAALVWFFQTCVTALVLAVLGLIALGTWTTVDGIRRMI